MSGPKSGTRAAVIRRDGFACRYCGAILLGDLGVHHGRTVTLDHVIPKMHGGSNHVQNLLVACAACNHRKSANSGWKPFPPRFFDDAVERAVLFHAELEAWTPTRVAEVVHAVKEAGEPVADAVGRDKPKRPAESVTVGCITSYDHSWGELNTGFGKFCEICGLVQFYGKKAGTGWAAQTEAGSGVKPGRLRVVPERTSGTRQKGSLG